MRPRRLPHMESHPEPATLIRHSPTGGFGTKHELSTLWPCRGLPQASRVFEKSVPQFQQNLIDLIWRGGSESLGNQSFDTILEAAVRHSAPRSVGVRMARGRCCERYPFSSLALGRPVNRALQPRFFLFEEAANFLNQH